MNDIGRIAWVALIAWITFASLITFVATRNAETKLDEWGIPGIENVGIFTRFERDGGLDLHGLHPVNSTRRTGTTGSY